MTLRLFLQTLALLSFLALAMGIQLSMTLFYGFADDLEWTLAELSACERSLPEHLKAILIEERQDRIVRDTAERLLGDLDASYRSQAARRIQRWLWQWRLPRALSEADLLGLYLRTWPYAEGRGLCQAAQAHFAQPLHTLETEQLRQLLGEETP